MASLDVYEFAHHLRRRLRIPLLACAVAFGITLVVSLITPAQYTATARILIESPAGGDGRSAMSVSPIYLEMLRSYEHFAMSDSLFQRALDKFQLRKQQPGRAIESWKRAILDVEIPHNTKIMEIRAKLPDAKRAQALAQFIAEETASMTRAVSRQGDQDLILDLEAQAGQLRQAREEAEASWKKTAAEATIEGLEVDLQALRARRVRTERALLAAQSSVVELGGRKSLTPEESTTLDAGKARAAYLRDELKTMDQELQRISRQTEDRLARRDQAESRKNSAQTAFQRVQERLQEARASAGSRAERLRVIDPGIVPERPTSPNIQLNLIVAVLFALVVSLLYLTLEFAWQAPRRAPAPLRMASRGGDD